MILVLDDDLDRIAWFRSVFGRAMDWTASPEEAIMLLRENTYTLIFLDHDLLPEHYLRDTPCEKTTGLRVAKWLNENNVQGKVIIHTRNWNGAARMATALPRAECIPFPELNHCLSRLIKLTAGTTVA